ncbi:MAG: hypothetical protein HY935_01915 [Nitrosomonadales bacterium]|nr:hypothetical protein [Nitrosomonadales bacterium]
MKGTKKFVIGAFQVRFRETLTGKLDSKDKNCRGTLVSLFSLQDNQTLFQSVTEELYKKFVADMKQRGFQIVNFAEMQKQSDFSTALKGQLNSGKYAELTAPAISNPYGADSVMGHLPGIASAIGSQETAGYSIYVPDAVPLFEYSLPRGMADDFDVVVLPGNLPAHRIDAAAKLGAGVITVGFEVELMKFNYDACTIKTELLMTQAPMVRTRLTAFNAFPVGAKIPFTLWGRPVDNGIIMTPKSRGGPKGSGFISDLMSGGKEYGTRWSEVDDGAVTINYSKGSDALDEKEVVPVAAKFPTAFKKSTDAHLQMIMHVLDHEAAYK